MASNVTPRSARHPSDRNDPLNRDPITEEPGAHPVGVGIGAGTGALTGAAVGATAGPVGAAIGAVAGGIAGGYMGKVAAEEINPTNELDYWRSAWSTRPYARDRSFNDFEPAYRVAVNEYSISPMSVPFERVEPRIRTAYESAASHGVAWQDAREASRDAWNRAANMNAELATEAEKSSADQINDVLQMLNDSVEGFNAAADRLDDPQFVATCRRYSDERRRLADELKPVIAQGGREPTTATEIRGALSRAWMSVRSALGGGDQAIIESIEAAEDHAVETYRRALASDRLTSDSREILYRQFPTIKAAHDQFSTWKHQSAAA